MAKDLISNFKFNVIRGNFNEINYLARGKTFTGVDSRDDNLSREEFIDIALELQEKSKATVVVSGKYEVIANSHLLISIPGGDENLKKITGLGDMESAMITSLLAAPMSNLKACALAAIFLRQLGKSVIRDNKVNAQDIISKMQGIDEISGDLEILSPSTKFIKPILYGISEGDDLWKIRFKEIREALLIPVFPIGGISKDKLDFFNGLDLDGLCMSRAIFSVREDEVEKNVREIIEKLNNL